MSGAAFDRDRAIRGATAALTTYARARAALLRTRTGTTQRTRDASSRLFAALSVLQANIPTALRSSDGVGDAPAPSQTPSTLPQRIGAWVDSIGQDGLTVLGRAVDTVNRVCDSIVGLYGRFWAGNPLGRTLIDMYAAVRASAREALVALNRVGTGFGVGAGAVVAGVVVLWLFSKRKKG